MDLRTADDVLAVLNRLDPMLRQADFLITDQALMAALEKAYPEAFPGSTYQDMASQQIIWNERTRSLSTRKSRIENSVIQQQRAALQRADRIEAAGRASGGIRGAQLATDALLTELMGSLNSQITATVAQQRALAEVQYRAETSRKAANATAEEFMSNLATR